jgi:glycosyltransferase involved in cell wall biosynthesis
VHPHLNDPSAGTRRIVEQGGRFENVRAAVKRVAQRTLANAGYVRRSTPRVKPDVDLIHSAQFLLRANTPYVVDFEQLGTFALWQPKAFDRPWARARLRRLIEDERCKRLLPWSDAAALGLRNVLGDDVPKLTTVRPAIRPLATRPRTKDGRLRVLFVGTAFYEKGGIEALAAAQRANLQLDVISYVPPEVAIPPNVTVHVPGPRALVDRLYAECHVLLFPSHMDTFGYVVLEAMAHGLPVIAPGHLALNELIDDASGVRFAGENMLYGDDGLCRFLYTNPYPASYLEALRHPSDAYIDGIVDALHTVDKDYDRLAAGALAKVKHGMDERRALLARIYGDATS